MSKFSYAMKPEPPKFRLLLFPKSSFVVYFFHRTMKSKHLSIILGLILGSLGLKSQQTPVYRLNWAADGPILGGMAASYFVLNENIRRVDPLTIAQIAALDPANIPGIDRSATRYLSPRIARASDLFLLSSALLPMAALANKKVRSEAFPVAIMWTETLVITVTLTDLTKLLAKRSRPFVYNPRADLGEKQRIGARQSFLSGHTSMAAGFSFFSAKVFNDLFPDSKAKPWVWGGAAAVPAIVGFFRYRSGKHFPTDILAGYALGSLIGWGVPQFHKRKAKDVTLFPVLGNGQGLGLVYRF